MSCTEIQKQINQLEDMERDIEDKTGMSGRNVGMALLFWPGVLINEMNADDAEDRINQRKSKLFEMYDQKGCR